MIFIIESKQTNLITTENLEYSDWLKRLDQFKSVTNFNDRDEMLAHIKIKFELNSEKIETVTKCLTENSTAKYFRYFGYNSQTFKIEPVYLNLNRFEGRLIYWKDWDYIFYNKEEKFCLWVYIGGMSDMWRKIILNNTHVKKYITNGDSEIDYLVNDLRNWKTSIEYEKAKKENRIIY